MRNEALEIPQRDSFHYLDPIISKDGKVDEDVKHKVKAGWLKLRHSYGVFCDFKCQQDHKMGKNVSQSSNDICSKWTYQR